MLLDLYDIAEENDVIIADLRLNARAPAISVMDNNGNCCIGMDSKQLVNEADIKLKLAHELGHCLTGSFYNRFSMLNVISKQERKANKWAIEKLVTKDELDNAVRMGYTELWQLAEYFDIPQDFMEKIVCEYEGLEWS